MADFAYQILFDGDAAEDDFYADILELSIDVPAADAATVRLRLAIAVNDDGEWTYLDDDRLSLFSPVEIRLGYQEGEGLAGALGGLLGGGGNDGLIPVFTGFVHGVDVQIGSVPGQSQIDVSLTDTSLLMGLEDRIAVWTDVSDSEVIERIAGAYADNTEVDSTETVHAEDGSVLVQRGTDLQFVRMLARRNGLEFAFETDAASSNVTAIATLPQLDGTPQPDLAVLFGDQSNLASFHVRVDGRLPLNVDVSQVDISTKSANSAQVSDISLNLLGADDLGALAAGDIDALAPPQTATSQLMLLGPPTSDSTELTALAQSVRDTAGWFMTATGEINCDAYGAVLQPRRTVLVKGAGSLYSGTYYVTGVTHRITSDGRYRQTFEAKRNALGLDGSEEFGADSLGLSLPGI